VLAIEIMNLSTPGEDHRWLNLQITVIQTNPGLKNLDGLRTETTAPGFA
jgi:hypothetical protein